MQDFRYDGLFKKKLSYVMNSKMKLPRTWAQADLAVVYCQTSFTRIKRFCDFFNWSFVYSDCNLKKAPTSLHWELSENEPMRLVVVWDEMHRFRVRFAERADSTAFWTLESLLWKMHNSWKFHTMSSRGQQWQAARLPSFLHTILVFAWHGLLQGRTKWRNCRLTIKNPD